MSTTTHCDVCTGVIKEDSVMIISGGLYDVRVCISPRSTPLGRPPISDICINCIAKLAQPIEGDSA